jgi:L,D-transpeptidase ErfK/SrfK
MSVAKNSVTTFCVIAVLGLSGCQSLSFFNFSNRPVALSPEAGLRHEITSHDFEVEPDQNVVGTVFSVETRDNDTLPDIARHFGLGYNDITRANPVVSAWTPRPNSKVILPLKFILPDGPRKGIVLNLANMRLFYYPKRELGKVLTFPVGIGRDGWNTPMGLTSVAVKTPNPVWHVPSSIHKEHAQKGHILPAAVRAGPDNPLGQYAMRLAIGSYLIHGTNKPFGIGMQISHGCVQMYPEDIEVLFHKVSVGTPVRIIHQPYLLAWHNNDIYLEANEPIGKWFLGMPRLKKQTIKDLRKLSKLYHVSVDWDKVNSILDRADGIPTPVSVNSPDISQIAKTAPPVARPARLHGQPVVQTLTDSDWAMLVATFKSEDDAQKLAAMLNHQGPPIPARKVAVNNVYQVVAGPFGSKKEAQEVASRIHFDFEIDTKLLPPVRSSRGLATGGEGSLVSN